VKIRSASWDDAAAVLLREAQRAEIAERYGSDDSEPGPAPTADDITVFLVAYDGDEPIGWGGLRAIDQTHGEIKRMFVTPTRRGSGVSTAILRALEDQGRSRGWSRLVLETGDQQPDAIRFYEREGYTRIPNYGHYAHSAISLCYEHAL
jgi:putative acetyltransferase